MVTIMFGLLDELFGWYTELVTVGSVGPVTPQPAPEPLRPFWNSVPSPSSRGPDSSVSSG